MATKKSPKKSSTKKALATTVEPIPVTKPQAKITSSAKESRERRSSDRRGRNAVKSPPGTRTKMLKIIYDKRAELAQRRRHHFVIKLAILAVLAGSGYYALASVWQLTTSATSQIVESIDMGAWWDKVSKADAPKPKPKKRSFTKKNKLKKKRYKSNRSKSRKVRRQVSKR